MPTSTIAYTKTDEALARHIFATPHPQSIYCKLRIKFELKDISLAGRILANFSDSLTPEQDSDVLAERQPLTNRSQYQPNISASIQLQDAIKELQGKGFAVPDFPSDPQTDEEKENRNIYAKVLGSGKPGVERGNSDRRLLNQ